MPQLIRQAHKFVTCCVGVTDGAQQRCEIRQGSQAPTALCSLPLPPQHRLRRGCEPESHRPKPRLRVRQAESQRLECALHRAMHIIHHRAEWRRRAPRSMARIQFGRLRFSGSSARCTAPCTSSAVMSATSTVSASSAVAAAATSLNASCGSIGMAQVNHSIVRAITRMRSILPPSQSTLSRVLAAYKGFSMSLTAGAVWRMRRLRAWRS